MFRGNQIANGLRLGQVHLAIEESACGEFPRTRMAAPCIHQSPDGLRLNEGRTVYPKLHRVFAGVGSGCSEHGCQALVDGLTCGIPQDAKYGAVRFHSSEVLRKDPVRQVKCVWTRYPDYGDSAHSHGCRQGTNGFSIKSCGNSSVHGAKFA